MNIPNWVLVLFGLFGLGFMLLGPNDVPLWNLVILCAVLLIAAGILGAIWYLAKSLMIEAGLVRRETISEAMNAAGHDGRPRTFVLKDGSRYSGMFRDPNGHIIVTDIQPRSVVAVEYPEG